MQVSRNMLKIYILYLLNSFSRFCCKYRVDFQPSICPSTRAATSICPFFSLVSYPHYYRTYLEYLGHWHHRPSKENESIQKQKEFLSREHRTIKSGRIMCIVGLGFLPVYLWIVGAW